MGVKTLFAELKDVRQNLRADIKKSSGQNVNVCSDSVLSAMAKAMPKNINELATMPQVTEEFVANYGKAFVQCIIEYSMMNNLYKDKNSSYMTTLKELEKKLVNLSRRNKLLYTNKLANKYAVDLLDIIDKASIIKFLFDKNVKEINVCDLTVEGVRKSKNNEIQYNKLVGLSREVNREMREKGQYDLYIAYPFVRGRIAGQDFELNAPLVLFPVTLTKETNWFTIAKDYTRDVVYNNNILLANYKFNKINKPLPNNAIFELNELDFYHNIVEFYESEKINITPSDGNMIKYVPPCDSTREFKRGEMVMYGNVLIGKYSTYSSSMQKDLNSIINSGTINPLLEDLLSGMDDYDFYDEVESGEALDFNQSAKESELCYITPINSTQENVILASDNCKELVVQGPPGTGKSQVITSLIANAVAKKKTVLMVSEKKSALDVVYSRLGTLSKYVLLLDDVNNKDIFYNQIDSMCKVEPSTEENETLSEVEVDIEECMDSMKAIANKLCDKSEYGIEVFKLYQLAPKWDLTDKKKSTEYNAISKVMPDSVKACKYQELKKLYLAYKNNDFVEALCEYKQDATKYPELFYFKTDISQAELARLHNECEQMVTAEKILAKYGLDKKRVVKKAFGKQAKAWFKCAYEHKSNGNKLDYLDNTEKYSLMTSKYDNFIKTKQEYDELSDLSRDYFNALYQVAVEQNLSVSNANELLYKYIINQYLIEFETDNRLVLNKIYDYNNVLNRLSELLDNKMAITKENLAVMFESNLQGLINSKRYGEIRRMIESNRRWSVAKFVDKFFLELFMSIKVWLLTPEVVSEILPLKPELFDLVIFDEASQMYVEKGIPAILRAKSVIIAGDSNQLRPSNLGSGRIDYDDDDLLDDIMQEDTGIAALEEESLLDVARFKYPPMMLDFHYRSKYSELIAFSNYAFYGGQLNVSPNSTASEKPPIKVVKVKGGLWENRANRAEATAVVDQLKSFFRNRKNNETVGIITFNSAQRDLILDIIDEVSKKDKKFAKAVTKEFDRKENGEDIGLFVKNIENVQGDERDYIIFSIGYAQNEKGKVVNNFGWLSQRGGENRLNVAISRAKLQIIIVSSIDPSDLNVENCKNRGPLVLKKYLEYANFVSKGDKEGANGVLLSFVDNDKSTSYSANRPAMAQKLREELESNGYTVEENVGVGAYTIDMAIVRNGRYILGIEFDSSLYSTNINNRERDYHRWKYFKLRGWNIYRIWSSAWWDSPQEELDKVLTRLNKICLELDQEQAK